MKKRHLAVACSIGLTALLALTACAGSSAGSSSSSHKGSTLTVWLMQDTLTSDSQAAIVSAFEKKTGAKVKVEIQQWDNINTKLTSALATDTPPDVIEIGNTDVPLFAANGALMDVTSQKKAISGGNSWLTGLEGPATVEGKLYAAPFYAGTRAVIYNKKTWSDAGITQPPASYTDLTADLDKLKAANPAADFSPIYLTGTYWYNALSFLYDAGGKLASEKGGKWTADLSTPESQKGLSNFKAFQNKYSTAASQSAPMDTPNPVDVIGTGKAATIMGNGNALKTLVKSHPELQGQIGSFPFPSQMSPGKNMPNFLGGSDIAVAAKSKNQDLAVQFLTYIDSPKVQLDQISALDGHIPVSQSLIDQATKTLPDEMKAFYSSAKLSISTPATPGWATIESDNSVVDFFSQIATGSKSVQQAAADFDKHLQTALNAK